MEWFEKLVSSHVGSYPLNHSEENVIKAFNDTVEAGVDVPPIPQLRSFIEMYLEPLVEEGVLRKKGGFFLASPEDLEGLKPLKLRLEEAEVISRERRGARWVRAPVTGAMTLASNIFISDPSRGLRATALARKELVLDVLSSYVGSIVRSMRELGFEVIVVDEPMLANVVGTRAVLFGYSEEDILELYARELKPARGALTGTHVCGRISEKLVEILVESEAIRFLNHEFYGTPENLGINWRRHLEEGDKFLAPGVLSSKRPEVERVEEVQAFARKVMSIAGVERVNLLSPDCGFAGLRGVPGAYEISIEKLRVLARAVAALRAEQRG